MVRLGILCHAKEVKDLYLNPTNAAEEIKLKAEISEHIHPQLINIQHSWNGARANILPYDIARAPISSISRIQGSSVPGDQEIAVSVTSPFPV
jgi:hypothetical protein